MKKIKEAELSQDAKDKIKKNNDRMSALKKNGGSQTEIDSLEKENDRLNGGNKTSEGYTMKTAKFLLEEIEDIEKKGEEEEVKEAEEKDSEEEEEIKEESEDDKEDEEKVEESDKEDEEEEEIKEARSAKAVLESLKDIFEADDAAKIAALSKEIEALANKSDRIDMDAKKEFNANGRTKKFFQMKIESEKIMIACAKLKLERYKAKGGEGAGVKRFEQSIKDSEEMVKDFTAHAQKAK